MIIVMDVGNTNIVLGMYKEDKLLFTSRMKTDKEKTSDEYGLFLVNVLKIENIDIKDIEAVIIASVVPSIMYTLENVMRNYFKITPIIVNSETETGLDIKCDNPKEVGVDRIVNAAAAQHIYGGALVVVDFGTATTFCAVNSKKEYLGGVICPGIKISMEALFQKTAKLPRIEIVKPDSVIGKNTIGSMQSGIVYGYAGQVDYIVERMKKEMNEENIKVIATGGLVKLISSESKTIDEINGQLTLEGLRLIYNRNKKI